MANFPPKPPQDPNDANTPNTPPGWQKKPPVRLPAQSAANSRDRVDFNVQKFDLLILQKGIRVKVYRSLMCPNLKSIDGGEHEIDCPVCRGNHFVDVNPIETYAMTQTNEYSNRRDPEGMYGKDTVKMTFARNIELQYFTLVELCDFTDIFLEVIKRQRAQTDVLKYRACCVNALVDADNKSYYMGQDFEIDPNGSIQWLPNKGPIQGTLYSVHYNMKKQYRAISAEHVDRYTQVRNTALGSQIEMIKMPECWTLQKDYFVERKDIKGNPLQPNLIRDEDDSQD